MMLTDPTVIRDTLGFDDMADINDAIDAALVAATPVLAANLRSEFDKKTWIDTFYVDTPAQRMGNLLQTEFLLSTGFVTQITKMESSTGFDLFGGTDVVDRLGTTRLDKDRGVIKSVTPDYTGMFVQITYEAGFDVSGTDPDMYEAVDVPPWLQEAAKVMAMMSLANNPVVRAVDDGGGSYAGIANHPTGVLRRQLEDLISVKRRYAPLAHMPVM